MIPTFLPHHLRENKICSLTLNTTSIFTFLIIAASLCTSVSFRPACALAVKDTKQTTVAWVCVSVCVSVGACVGPVLWPMDNSREGRVWGSVGFGVAVRVWELRGGAMQIRLWQPSINEVITSLRPGPRPLPGRGQPRLTTNTVESNQLTHQCQEQPHNRGNLRKPHVTEEWLLSGGCGRFGIPAVHFLSFSLCLG